MERKTNLSATSVFEESTQGHVTTKLMAT